MLTDHLQSLSTRTPYASATKHHFLVTAGNGTLTHKRLALWLSQDRIYAAHAYPRFIGDLISKIPFSARHSLESPEEASNNRILKTLVFSLQNVVREVGFFKEASAKWDLPLEGWPERKGTRDYAAEMARVSRDLNDGLIFLWAMEKVYLDAWSGVRDGLLKVLAPGPNSNSPTLEALTSFAANWTSGEFVEFVDELAGLVNALDIAPGSDAWRRAEEIWERVIELEEAFWPSEYEV